MKRLCLPKGREKLQPSDVMGDPQPLDEECFPPPRTSPVHPLRSHSAHPLLPPATPRRHSLSLFLCRPPLSLPFSHQRTFKLPSPFEIGSRGPTSPLQFHSQTRKIKPLCLRSFCSSTRLGFAIHVRVMHCVDPLRMAGRRGRWCFVTLGCRIAGWSIGE